MGAIVPQAGHKPCLFLSHSGVDSEAAKELKRRILATKAAKHAGLTVWLDKDDLLPGVDDWQKQLEIALTREATAFAVLVGSKGVVNWVEREVRIGLSLATGDDAIPFIPILAKDSPGVSALPPFAQQHQGVRDPLGNEEELQRLVAAVLWRKPSETPLIEEPFVGLRAMREDDAGRFFGRDAEVADLVAALKRHRLLAVVADSGAGKSSLAMAGLVPAFRGGAFADSAGRGPDKRTWHAVVMRPGADPLEGLRRGLTEAARKLGLTSESQDHLRQRISLNDPSRSTYALRCDLPFEKTETLLVVDQFDELLSEAPEDQRGLFVDFLIKLASVPEPGGFRVLLTVRADYFNLCRPLTSLYKRLTAADDPATFRLRRISDAGLDQAVRRPLELAGYNRGDDVDRLASRILNDLGDRAGDLALVQMALYVVWGRRGGPDSTLIDAYVDAGGVIGALALEAELVRTQRLKPDEADRLTSLFVRLVRLGDTGGAVRRICFRSELDLPRLALAEKLCSDEFGRLLLAGEDTFEVCHEALITQWPWLQDELNRAAADLRDFEPLMPRATTWVVASEEERGGRLATGLERAAFSAIAMRRGSWLSKSEQEFVAASEAAHRREQMLRRWRWRAAIAASLLLTIVSGLAGWSAWRAAEEAARADELASIAADVADKAERAAKAAVLNETISLAALSRIAMSDNLPVHAAKLALAAWPRVGDDDRPALRRVVDAMIAALPHLSQQIEFAGTAPAFSPKGDQIAVVSGIDDVSVLYSKTGEEIATFGYGGQKIYSIGWSSDSTRLLVQLGNDRAVISWVWTGRKVAQYVGNIKYPIFSPDGEAVASILDDKVVVVWDSITGNEIFRFEPRDIEPWDSIRHLDFSSDGRLIAILSGFSVSILEVSSRKEVARFVHEDLVEGMSFSPDGARLLTAADKSVHIWDINHETEIANLNHDSDVASVVYSQDGSLIMTTTDLGGVIFWDAKGAKKIRRLQGEKGRVDAVLSNDSALLLTVTQGERPGTARLWDASTGVEIAKFRFDGAIESIGFSPDSKRAVAATYRTARVLDVSALQSSNASHIACLRLGTDTSLLEVQERYGLADLPPICGDHLPMIVDWAELQ